VIALVFLFLATALLPACAPRPELTIDNQSGVTLKGEVQWPIRETLGRWRPGPVVFVRVLPGATWNSGDAPPLARTPEAVEDVIVRLADASLVAQAARPVWFAYSGRIGRATVTVAPGRVPGALSLAAVDAAGNPVELFGPPAPVALPPDDRRPVLDAPRLGEDLYP
jgi:hypothetical protein